MSTFPLQSISLNSCKPSRILDLKVWNKLCLCCQVTEKGRKSINNKRFSCHVSFYFPEVKIDANSLVEI